MKICVIQNKPIIGDIPQNIDNHLELIKLSLPHSPELIVFPELSITGYDYEAAQNLATDLNDSRFAIFQNWSDLNSVIIGIGVPIKDDKKTCISMILFQPNKPRHLYSKKYLHPDEEPYFSPGKTTVGLIGKDLKVALAICYEISVLAHVKNVNKCGAKVYLASVAKFENGIDKALNRLSDIGNEYSMVVLMANSVGKCGENICAGRSSIWDNNGLLLGQLNSTKEGILFIDTETKRVVTKVL
ncbi:MAG TPA: carbon-nitrogen hydrolase family protein [Anditalea sp.]|nr:carbon-nitrogen hydrolase family protein [Anditalea sp.]